MKHFALAAVALAMSGSVFAKDPDCSGDDGWPAAQVQVELMNSGLLDRSQADFTKTTSRQVSSQKIGKDLYRQVHLVRYVKKNGEVIQVMTVHLASNEECSLGPLDMYFVSKKTGDYADETGKPLPLPDALAPASAPRRGKTAH